MWKLVVSKDNISVLVCAFFGDVSLCVVLLHSLYYGLCIKVLGVSKLVGLSLYECYQTLFPLLQYSLNIIMHTFYTTVTLYN